MGPWLCKRNGRADHKLWVTVFVCMNTRAVHTECITEMNAKAMINAMVRFASRRPGVRSFFSDNGGNFTKAQRLLREEMETFAKMENGQMEMRGLRWELNPPCAPRRGGHGRGL